MFFSGGKTVNLDHLLTMHLQHSQQREWHQLLVHKSDSSVGMYHRRIVELLKKEFGCSDEVRRFRVELDKQEYVLCYYPVQDGRMELFPLEPIELATIEFRGMEP